MKRFTLRPVSLGLLLSVTAVLGLSALLLAAPHAHAVDAPAAAAPAKAALTVSVTKAASANLPIKLSANGNIAAWQEASIGAETGGLRVQELHANIGDSVRRGQLLATFAAESVQADVALARAALAEATANAAEAAANAERARAVKGSGALSDQQVNQYLTAELSAKARVDSAKAQLDSQLLRLQHAQVLAPDSGVISARSATVGAVLGAGTEMFRLIRQGRLEWRAEVTAAELGRIQVGSTVQVTTASGTVVKGKVRMVAPTVDTQTRAALVYVDLAGSPTQAGVKAGMFAKGEFALGNSAGLTVPQQSVVVRDGFNYVFALGAGNKVAQQKVEIGRRLGDQVEVLKGLQADATIAVAGAGFLNDGDTVRIGTVADGKAAAAAAK
ncbi:efflux RND transporter periplasmic adaptor subunit [Rhodoferax sp. GW822-FHT02A01]|uniref:efflux RND transporter periplasmic adaptor subunit n=1 Tax=Rhodoferax sp. GW822-FHT02A01 TaxID=3141537 RepID=UPI00315DEC87